MKSSTRYILAIILLSSSLLACKKEADEIPDPRPIDKNQLYGWWYNDAARSQHTEYKGRKFNQDGTMIADATNYGLGIGNYGGGTWAWSGDTLLLSGAGSVKFLVTRLDTDSLFADLIGATPGNTYKMYYGS